MTTTARNLVVGLFAITGALASFACSGADSDVGSTGASSQDQALEKGDKSCPVPPTPGPAPIACFGDSQGGPTSCKPSSVWKQYASDACKVKGAVVVAIDYADSCGKDLFRYTKYECCDAAPPPPPPPPACKTDVLGDATSCKEDATWKDLAFQHCADQKLSFSGLGLGTPCGKMAGWSSSVKVTCCAPPPPPPPPPPVCEWRELGGDTSCKDAGTWKIYADNSCTASGLKLGEISLPDAKCDAAGDTSVVKFTCCK